MIRRIGLALALLFVATGAAQALDTLRTAVDTSGPTLRLTYIWDKTKETGSKWVQSGCLDTVGHVYSPICNFTTPQSWGAKGDGEADDTIPVQKALASGRTVLCAGKYRIENRVSVTVSRTKGFGIQGGARYQCKFTMTNDDGNFDSQFVFTWEGVPNPFHPGAGLINDSGHLSLVGMTFDWRYALQHQPTVETQGDYPWLNAAIVLDGSALTEDYVSGLVTIRDLHMVNEWNAWANIGIYIKQMRSIQIDNYRYVGGIYYSRPANSAAIYYEGSQGEVDNRYSNIPTSLWLKNFSAFNVDTALFVKGHVEGLAVDVAEFIGVRVCIDAASLPALADGSPLAQIAKVECNTRDVGFDFANWSRLQITDNHIFFSGAHSPPGLPDPADGEVVGIRVTTTGDNASSIIYPQITNNNIEGWNRTTGTAVKKGIVLRTVLDLDSSNFFGTVNSNLFQALGTGLELGPTVDKVNVGCNEYLTVTNPVDNKNVTGADDENNYLSCLRQALPQGVSNGIVSPNTETLWFVTTIGVNIAAGPSAGWLGVNGHHDFATNQVEVPAVDKLAVSAIRVMANGTVTGGTYVATLYVNGSPTAVTCTIATGNVCDATVSDVIIPAGAAMTVLFQTNGASGPTNGRVGITARRVP